MAKGTSVRLSLRKNAIINIQSKTSAAAAARAARVTQGRIQDSMRRQGRVDTGKMVSETKIEQISTGPYTRFRIINKLPYMKWQEEGIGPFVMPKGKVMRFRPKGSNVFVFARRRKGFKGGHFFRDARKAIKARDFY